MDTNMFCFQCEQTAGCSGCTGKAGVCGKSAQTAQIQDQLNRSIDRSLLTRQTALFQRDSLLKR